ncbi:response regulator [Brevibacillus nitrificans]|uniref:Circadian input-output histidine kinase CikA n=1 Tax=Brevibacillus nitrificans TaxID=651560 RepID=A0A3M8D664_9BACL|nr:response regulator [Brevibacillus nitrificans]RNB83229.1 response regulator [Brevibacillus nitrificans]
MKSNTVLRQFLIRSGIIISIITLFTYGVLYQYITSEYHNNFEEEISIATGVITKAIESRQVATEKLEREIDLKLQAVSKAVSNHLEGRPTQSISSQELKELANQWGVYGISLLVKTENGIEIVQSSEKEEIGLNTKAWGYWYTAFQQLFSYGRVTVDKGYASGHYWVGPVSKSDWDADKFYKYAYYYDGKTEFIINTFVHSENIDRLILFTGISSLIAELNTNNNDIAEITVLNTRAWLKGRRNQIIEPQTDVPILYGDNRYALEQDKDKILALLSTKENQNNDFTSKGENFRKHYIALPDQRVLMLVQSEKRLETTIVKLNLFIISLLLISSIFMLILLRTATRRQLLALSLERKRLLLAEEFKQTMDMLPDVLFKCKYDASGNIVVTYLEGVILSDIGATPVMDATPVNDERVLPIFRQYISDLQRAFQGEMVQYVLVVGEEYYQVNVKPIYDLNETTVKGIAGYATEITERVRLEKQLEEARDEALNLAETKSKFLAMMSHELRTPLHSAGGMLELLGETPLTAVQRQYLQAARNAGKTLLVLINDLLDLTRLEFGKIDLEIQPFYFQAFMEKTIELMSVLADKKGLMLSYEISPEVPTILVGDSKRIRQVLMNLVGNAIKFTDKGSIHIRVGIVQKTEQGVLLGFVIKDTGIGIAPEHRETIFDQFIQADASISRRFGGSGLGLTISKYLIETMSGKIMVESELGKGSKFIFTIQMGMIEEVASIVEIVTKMEKKHIEASSVQVLLVDDREENRNLIKAYLSKSPVKIEEAENGVEAVRLFRLKRFDLVLMDIQMPFMDGYQTTEAIRQWELEHGLPPTPVIALTANSSQEAIQQSLKSGCTEHLVKPVNRSDVNRCISKYAPIQMTKERQMKQLEGELRNVKTVTY